MDGKFQPDQFAIKERKEEEVPLEELFGFKLRAARRAARETLRTLAKKLGLSTPDSVSKWEKGESFPDESRLEAIAQICKWELGDLREIFRISRDRRAEFLEAKKRPKSRPVVDKDAEVYIGGSTGGNTGYQRKS